MASSSYSVPRSHDSQSIQRLVQSVTVNIQKIAQNGNIKTWTFIFLVRTQIKL